MKRDIDMFRKSKTLGLNGKLGMMIAGLILFNQTPSYGSVMTANCSFMTRNTQTDTYFCNNYPSGYIHVDTTCYRYSVPQNGEEYVQYFFSTSYDTANQCDDACYKETQGKSCEKRFLHETYGGQ